MKLMALKNQNKNELSLIEVAFAILAEKGESMSFVDLVNATQDFLERSDAEIRERLPQFYTELNINGEFISLGDNVWGLRSWYPFDSVDEEVNHPESVEEEEHKSKGKHRVNAFLADAAEIIDYNNDDPEDESYKGPVEFVDNEGIAEDSPADLGDFNQEFADNDANDEDPDVGISDGVEGQLHEIGDFEPRNDDTEENFVDFPDESLPEDDDGMANDNFDNQ